MSEQLADRATAFNQSIELIQNDKLAIEAKRETIRSSALDGTITRSELDTLRSLADDALILDIRELTLAKSRSAIVEIVKEAFTEYMAAAEVEKQAITEAVEAELLDKHGYAVFDAALLSNERWCDLARQLTLFNSFKDEGALANQQHIAAIEGRIRSQI